MAEVTLTIVDEQVVIETGEDTSEAFRQRQLAETAASTATAISASPWTTPRSPPRWTSPRGPT